MRRAVDSLPVVVTWKKKNYFNFEIVDMVTFYGVWIFY